MEKIVLILVLVMMASVIYPAAAQEQAAIPALLVETDAGIIFYGLGDTNELEQVGSLPPDFVLEWSKDDKWVLRTEFENNVTLSPDHQSLAFTARSFVPPIRVKLFFYNLKDKQLREGFSGAFDIAGDLPHYDFWLYWSPDSQRILANPHVWCCENPYEPIPEIYIYDLATNEWWSVTNTPDRLEWEPAWSSDSKSIAYRVSWMGDFFYLVDWQGNNRQLLAKQDFSIPDFSYLSLCDFTWSNSAQRWYYVIGRCNSRDSDNRAYIASVNVQGDDRIEVHLSDLLLKEVSQFLEQPYIATVDVKDIQVAEDGVYVGFDFMYMADDENDRPLAKRTYRVIRISAPEVAKTVFEFTFDDDFSSSLSQAAFAPDGSKVALVSTKKIMVGDLTTGQQLATTSRNLEDYWRRFKVRWLDENRLLYNDETDVWLLDSRDGTNTNLTADIEPTAWLIPQTNSN